MPTTTFYSSKNKKLYRSTFLDLYVDIEIVDIAIEPQIYYRYSTHYVYEYNYKNKNLNIEKKMTYNYTILLAHAQSQSLLSDAFDYASHDFGAGDFAKQMKFTSFQFQANAAGSSHTATRPKVSLQQVGATVNNILSGACWPLSLSNSTLRPATSSSSSCSTSSCVSFVRHHLDAAANQS